MEMLIKNESERSKRKDLSGKQLKIDIRIPLRKLISNEKPIYRKKNPPNIGED